MPRQARVTVAGMPLHVIHRGNNRSACFVADADRSFYLFHLDRGLTRFGCALHAYCLMTNHVHLLLTPSTDQGCGQLMKYVGQLYAHYVNRTYSRTGSLWEGRFRSCLVQSENYLLACYRYIELNPVRAGLVQHPRDYEWCSYRANTENGPRRIVVTPHPVFMRLGSTDVERRRSYAELVVTGVDDVQLSQIRLATNGGHALA